MFAELSNCILITIPNPGTISLPLGTLAATGTSFFSAELEADEVVVELADFSPVADVIVVPCTSLIVGASAATGDATSGGGATGSGGDGAGGGGATTLVGLIRLIGLIGLAGLLIFVAVIMHVSDVVDHDVHIGVEYGSEQVEERVCVMFPV